MLLLPLLASQADAASDPASGTCGACNGTRQMADLGECGFCKPLQRRPSQTDARAEGELEPGADQAAALDISQVEGLTPGQGEASPLAPDEEKGQFSLQDLGQFKIGDRIEGNYQGEGTWYPATYKGEGKRGYYLVTYDDTPHDVLRAAKRHVRRLKVSQEEQTQPPTSANGAWIQWGVFPHRGLKTAPESALQPDKKGNFIIKGACCGEANGTYEVQHPGRMPRNWRIDYENGKDGKTPENWKKKCASKPWYLSNKVGYYKYYIRYNSTNDRWELRHPCDGKVVYRQRGKAISSAAAATRALHEAARKQADRHRQCRERTLATQREELEMAKRESAAEHARAATDIFPVKTGWNTRNVCKRNETSPAPPLAPPISEPQLPAGQFYLPSTMKVIPDQSQSHRGWSTVKVDTDDKGRGSACPLLGVYVELDDSTRPRSWIIADEDGNDDASEADWKRKFKLSNRPWYRYEIKGSEHNFYIRYNNPEKRWCLYDNFHNDNKGRWIYHTNQHPGNPKDEKWMLHGKCSALNGCKGTGKRHGQDPSSCYNYTGACTCGLKCKVCDGSGKVWENRIWPF